MNCPRCSTALNKETLRVVNESIEIDTCSSCGGRWFEKDELSKAEKIVEPTMLEIRRIPKEEEQMEGLYCPSCKNGKVMAKIENPRDAYVIMDYCPMCNGIWLDKGELEAIQKENWAVTLIRMRKWLMREESE